MVSDEKDGPVQQNRVALGIASHEIQKSASDETKTEVEGEISATMVANEQTWSFSHTTNNVNLRGGGCASSLLCGIPIESEHPVTKAVELEMSDVQPKQKTLQQQQQDQEKQDGQDEETMQTDNSPQPTPIWTGWAELENDPEIFTIILQDWGVPNVQVNEILDIVDLTLAQPIQTLGLIFLSRYIPPDQTNIRTSSPTKINVNDGKREETASQPWFANQISKFSCGSVALMNILMNSSPDTDLSETLLSFKQSTLALSSKDRGIALDSNAQFRHVHNSFSTKLDRMIVDVMLKEEAQKHKQRLAAQARQSKLAENPAAGKSRGSKRKRGGTSFTKRRKRKTTTGDEEEAGFHFVAYVSAHNLVWKLDGMQNHPRNIGCPDEQADQTWLNVAAADLIPQMEEALSSGQECSLMIVTKTSNTVIQNGEVQTAQETEKQRKQEDWAPFIEHMLRLHAEKGDLQELLGL